MNDENELTLLAKKVLLQAVGDYIRLQHPTARKRTSQMSSFLSAGDMLYDDDYRMAHFKTGEGEDMWTQEFVALALESSQADLGKLRAYIRKESLNYWQTRELAPMKIPEVIVIQSEPWHTFFTDTPFYYIDFDKRSIFLSEKVEKDEQSKQFILALVDIMFDCVGLRSSGAKRREFADLWFEILTMNNGFE